ncbi:hypothetical protein SRABI27_03728 [Pedobacter sp. Bi27]|uniref:DUF3892 domain-containing protein n=1 Tax=Pedobacter sp. Bi27 TaxID=2822351 RepID=UPI001DDF0181|nr:DUF3892 domain-containing protein [Pedobacter sp. Bi27]CAH0279342.1 hypothetical protein SRABI27_03728 [Pedobacter sp. Bi27]
MADSRITHIRKKDRNSTSEHITHAGVPGSWYWTREQIIESINKSTNTFFVEENGNRSNVGVVNPTDGRSPYIRTHADGKWNDNLLALPEH